MIVPAYRPDRGLITAVQSILDQSWADLEVLVIDDASPAECGDLFDEVAGLDPRVRVIRADENGGTYVARNIGLGHAGGSYVTFQDADDWSHPRRIEFQLRPLAEQPRLLATRSRAVRAHPDLGLTYVGYPPMRVNASSLLFRRDRVLGLMGRFDDVRKSADVEFPGRLQAVAPKSILDLVDDPPLSITQLRQGSLSRSDAVPGWLHWERIAYRDRYQEWHNRVRTGLAPARLPQRRRPFPVPTPAWAPRRFAVGERRHFDIVYLTDWRVGQGPAHGAVGEVMTLAAAGRTVGVADAEAMIPFTPQREAATWSLPRLLTTGVPFVHLDQDIDVDVLVVANPAILQTLADVPRGIRVGTVMTVLDIRSPGAARDEVDLGFRIADCDAACERLFGTRPAWFPRGAEARAHLVAADAGVRVAMRDLPRAPGEPVRSARNRRRAERPVIGHHLPDSRRSWPDHADALRAVYPEDPDAVDVRVLRAGGSAAAILRLPAVPSSWVAYNGLRLTPRQFLRQLEYYVYFGAGGRTDDTVHAALEAMTAGCVAVLPSTFADDFGEAAVYTTVDTAIKTIMELHADPGAYAEQRARGLAFGRAAAAGFVERMTSAARGARR